jgi:hypothetical protein
MKDIRLFVISFLIGIGLVFGYSVFKTQNFQQKPIIQKQKQTATFSIETPPSESLKGSIASRSGTLFWESRIATAPSELKDNVQIQQGERLITKDKSNLIVNFDHVCSIVFSENADLSFIQTLPIDFVVEQKKGTIKYVANGNAPLSIRIKNALITKISGMIQITVTDEDPIISISTVQGTAKIGFNDLDYNSQVFTLQEGQVYEYNNDERTAINTKNK